MPRKMASFFFFAGTHRQSGIRKNLLPPDCGSKNPAMLLIGWTTLPGREEAIELARSAVELRLAACGQVDGPIRSYYLWKGKFEDSEEFRLTLKFLPERSAKIEAWLRKIHPYETPQWVVVKAESVSEGYLAWARENTGKGC